MEEDMRKLNIIEDMAEDKTVEATHITSSPRSGKLGTINEEEEDDDIIIVIIKLLSS